MKDFNRLRVWEGGHRLVLAVYKATALFPKEERLGLASQMRRAAVSIPSNIAEGCGRRGEVEFKRFLELASGSMSELIYQLQLSEELGYIPPETRQLLHQDATQTQRMLHTLISTIKQSQSTKK